MHCFYFHSKLFSFALYFQILPMKPSANEERGEINNCKPISPIYPSNVSILLFYPLFANF